MNEGNMIEKPDNIAQDIWLTSWELWALLFTNRETDVVEIAAALQAERDACAGVAKKARTPYHGAARGIALEQSRAIAAQIVAPR
jgi:hypothetical protein